MLIYIACMAVILAIFVVVIEKSRDERGLKYDLLCVWDKTHEDCRP